MVYQRPIKKHNVQVLLRLSNQYFSALALRTWGWRLPGRLCLLPSVLCLVLHLVSTFSFHCRSSAHRLHTERRRPIRNLPNSDGTGPLGEQEVPLLGKLRSDKAVKNLWGEAQAKLQDKLSLLPRETSLIDNQALATNTKPNERRL